MDKTAVTVIWVLIAVLISFGGIGTYLYYKNKNDAYANECFKEGKAYLSYSKFANKPVCISITCVDKTNGERSYIARCEE